MIKKYHFNELYEKKQVSNKENERDTQHQHQKLRKTEAEFYTNLIVAKF
jgi:hypothetical protein